MREPAQGYCHAFVAHNIYKLIRCSGGSRRRSYQEDARTSGVLRSRCLSSSSAVISLLNYRPVLTLIRPTLNTACVKYGGIDHEGRAHRAGKAQQTAASLLPCVAGDQLQLRQLAQGFVGDKTHKTPQRRVPLPQTIACHAAAGGGDWVWCAGATCICATLCSLV